MPRENGFENKRVVIVGGSSGIGLAVAEEANFPNPVALHDFAYGAVKSFWRIDT